MVFMHNDKSSLEQPLKFILGIIQTLRRKMAFFDTPSILMSHFVIFFQAPSPYVIH